MDKIDTIPVLIADDDIESVSELKLISDHPNYQGSEDLRTHIGDTVKLKRPKITTDELGRNVWADGVNEYAFDFELEQPEVATDPYNNLKFEDY